MPAKSIGGGEKYRPLYVGEKYRPCIFAKHTFIHYRKMIPRAAMKHSDPFISPSITTRTARTGHVTLNAYPAGAAGKHTRRLSGWASVLVLILMLTHPALTLAGARRGLMLWAQTVLPTLLPFMIASNVLVAAGGLPILMTPLRPVFSGLFALTDEGGYVLACGLLCGCPMGAKTCAEFLEQGRITPAQARYLLAISNHPSPMFVLSYLASHLSPTVPVAAVLLSLYLPVLPLAALARRIYRPEAELHSYPAGRQSFRTENAAQESASVSAPGNNFRQATQTEAASASFDTTMMRSAEVMVRIGGYIMLFSILAAFLEDIPALPPILRAVFLGAVEITTGISAISQATGGPLNGLLITAVTAFGGLSGIMQTRSVISVTDESETAENMPAGKYERNITGALPAAKTRQSTTGAVPTAKYRHGITGAQPAAKENAGLSIRHYILWKLLHTLTACLLYSCLQYLPYFRLP